jgi:hypothetical protein
MQQIGERFGVPHEGFPTGQSRIYVSKESGNKQRQGEKDIRFEQCLRLLSKAKSSKAASANLRRTRELVDTDILLVLTTTARENAFALTSRSSEPRDTFSDGGLDFLAKNIGRLGLPRAIVGTWDVGVEGISQETQHNVHPGLIPVRDQILGYAAQTRLSFMDFQAHLRREIGAAEGQALIDALSDDARTVWQAYAFLAPAGAPFDPKKGPQHGQSFGVNPAFSYLRHLASQAGVAFDMNAILTTPALHHTDYVKIAKARAMEAAFFKALLERAGSAEAGKEQQREGGQP